MPVKNCVLSPMRAPMRALSFLFHNVHCSAEPTKKEIANHPFVYQMSTQLLVPWKKLHWKSAIEILSQQLKTR